MIHRLFLLTFISFTLFSCRTVDVNVDYNDKIDFFQFRTFNWLPRTGKDKDFSSVREQKILSQVESLLLAKQLNKSDKPDVLVAINVSQKDKVHYYPRHRYGHFRSFGGYAYGGFYAYEADEYTEYSVLVAIIEPKTKKALWEGSINNWSYQGVSDEKLNKLLSQILSKYPPIAENAYSDVPLDQ